MNKYTIIPSNLKYKGSPSVDEKVSVSLDQTSQQITEYDKNVTINLAQVYDNERQANQKKGFTITNINGKSYIVIEN